MKVYRLVGGTKTDFLAEELKKIIKLYNIQKHEYMIIASYCLKDVREITDLDVTMTEEAFHKIKHLGALKKAPFSSNMGIVISYPQISKDAEIEIYPEDKNNYFPTKDFSLKNLNEKNLLLYDSYGNPYYNIEMCVKQYTCIEKIGNEFYIAGKMKVSRERIQKNINHLQLLFNAFPQYREFIKKEIKYLQTLSGTDNTSF